MFIVNTMNYPQDKSNELPWSSIQNLLKFYPKFSEQKLQQNEMERFFWLQFWIKHIVQYFTFSKLLQQKMLF